MIFILLLLSCGTSSSKINQTSPPSPINVRFYLANAQKRILLPDGYHHWGDHILTGLECHNEPDSLTSLVLVPTLDGSLESIPLRERTHLYQFPIIDKNLPFPRSTPGCKILIGGEDHIQIPPSYQNKRERTFTDEFVFYLKITGFLSTIIKFIMSVVELKNNSDILDSFFTDTIQGVLKETDRNSNEPYEIVYFPSYERITFRSGFDIFNFNHMKKLWELFPTPKSTFTEFMQKTLALPTKTTDLSMRNRLLELAKSKQADSNPNIAYSDSSGNALSDEAIASLVSQRKSYENYIYSEYRKEILSHLKSEKGFRSNPRLFIEWLSGLNPFIEVDGLSRYKLGKAFFTMLPFVFFITLGSFLIFALSLEERDAMYKSSALYKKYTDAYKQAYITVKKNPNLWKRYYDSIMKADFITSSAIINPLIITYFNHQPLSLDYSMYDYLKLLIKRHPLLFHGTTKMDIDFVVDGIK